jgi:hypothetical protein
LTIENENQSASHSDVSHSDANGDAPDDLDDFYGTLPPSIANALKVALAAKKQVDQKLRIFPQLESPAR